MVKEDNGPESAYPGPAEPGSKDELYPDAQGDADQNDGPDSVEGDEDDDLVVPDNPPVDEDEEPSPGNSA
jgi:hypothetical protein